jgi:acetolactate synthase-1/3 small subunit
VSAVSADAARPGRRTAQTLIAYVQDRPGALNRVVSLFRRRGFNIDSLTVGRTERAGISRLTLVVQADDETAHRLESNLYKLVDILHVEDVSETAAVTRELAFVKVATPAERRSELLQLCATFRARVVDMAPSSIIVEITGAPEKLDGLIEVLRPFGILEMVRTGAVAMVRGPQPGSLPEVLDPEVLEVAT